MASSYLLYQTSSHPVKQDPHTIVTSTDIDMPGFSQKPYDPFTQNDTASPAGFPPPPPTRRPPPVPVPVPAQQSGLPLSSFSQRPMDILPQANIGSPTLSQSSSRNNSEPMQGRSNSVAQSSAGTNASNDTGNKGPGIFASLMGRAPRMTKSKPRPNAFILSAWMLIKR